LVTDGAGDDGEQEDDTVPRFERVELGPEVVFESAAPAPAAPAASSERELVGRVLAEGKLEVEELIGRGMMGSVYRAAHRRLHAPVAVKVMHAIYEREPDFARRFHAEALAASMLDHPNVARVIDFGQEPDGLLYMAMELLDGPSLREVIQREGPLPEHRIATLMMQICGGLGQAHARGIIHRDVKPDNVVLLASHDDDGMPVEQVKVCDFGLALLRAEDSWITSHGLPKVAQGSSAGSERFAGTPVYMSPEQCRGEELDLRTDVYACGVMLFELATGTVPFLDERPIVVVNRHLTMEPPALASLRPGIDPRLSRIVARALAKGRDQRHASMRELRAELKTLLAPAGSVDVGPASYPAAPASYPEAPVSYPPMPPSRPDAATAAPAESVRPPAPSWLEEVQDSYSDFLTTMGERRSAELSVVLARDPAPWLARLVAERDARTFDQLLEELGPALRVLAEKVDTRALRAVAGALRGIASDERRSEGARRRASSLLSPFADPRFLSPLAERLLVLPAAQAKSGAAVAARAILIEAGAAGAAAVYAARVKRAADPAVRAPFVELMRSFGASAWPVIAAALRKIPDAAVTGAHPPAATLACDLLRAAPARNDAAAGELASRYLRAEDASLATAAAEALGRAWAERAVPVLLELVDGAGESVGLAALAGLRQVGAIEPSGVRVLAKVATTPGASALRCAAVAALELVTDGARREAAPFLARVVKTDPDDALVAAASRALLGMLGNQARAVIMERCDRAGAGLKGLLLGLLEAPDLPTGP